MHLSDKLKLTFNLPQGFLKKEIVNKLLYFLKKTVGNLMDRFYFPVPFTFFL